MLKRLTVAFAALAIGLLPFTGALANEHEETPPEPTLSEVVAAAVADYLVGLDLSPEVAAEVGQTLGDLVQTLADEAAAEPANEEVDDEGEESDTSEEEGAAEEGEETEFEALAELEEEVEDDAHGEMVSMVAECAPRGKLLQGAGVNHGTFVSAVASGNPVVVPAVIEGEVDLEGGEEFTVETVEDAEALCEALETFAFDLEAAQAAAEEVDAQESQAEESTEVEAAAADGAEEDGAAANGKGNNARGGKQDR